MLNGAKCHKNMYLISLIFPPPLVNLCFMCSSLFIVVLSIWTPNYIKIQQLLHN